MITGSGRPCRARRSGSRAVALRRRFQDDRHPKQRRGLVQTPLGFLDLKNPRGLEKVPRGLIRAATRSHAGRGGMAPGANIVQISEQAMRDLGADAVQRELGHSGRVVAALPSAPS